MDEISGVNVFPLSGANDSISTHSLDGVTKQQAAEIDIHEKFCEDYFGGGEEEKANALNLLFSLPEFDPNYGDETFFVQAADIADTLLLERLIEKNKDAESLAKGLFEALKVAAYEGYAECVEFLIDHGAYPQSIVDYTAYNRYAHIKNLIDEKIANRQKTSQSEKKSLILPNNFGIKNSFSYSIPPNVYRDSGIFF